MKAVRIHEYGGDDVLRVEDVPEPTPGPDDVLVDVHAAAVNPVDWKIRSGSQRAVVRLRLPAILGMDVSGVVAAAGDRVTQFRAGDEVFASPHHRRQGGYAERVAIRAAECARKPANLTHVEAAALPLASLTAWGCLVDHGRVEPGQRVLIHAGAGGVGSVAIQLAKHLGAEVATTCSARNIDWVRSLGADRAIDYGAEDFAAVLAGEIDVAVDAVGGDVARRTVRAVRRGGRLVTIQTDLPAHVARFGPRLGVAVAAARLVGFAVRARVARGVRVSLVVRRPDGRRLARIAELCEAGALRPVVGAEFPLDDVAAAHRLSESGHARGKVVLRVR